MRYTPEEQAKVNVPLLRKAVEWVEEQDKLAGSKRFWRQDVWLARKDKRAPACDTAMCLAGKVAMDAGWRPNWDNAWEIDDGEVSFSFVSKGSRVRTVEDVANELLGLPETHSLFLASNTAELIRLFAEEIAGERL